jgi:hypothetical protein
MTNFEKIMIILTVMTVMTLKKSPNEGSTLQIQHGHGFYRC